MFNRGKARIPLMAVLFGASIVLAKAADYQSTVEADGPLAYFRMNDSAVHLNLNSGSAGISASPTNLNVRSYPGAIAGTRSRAQFFDGTARGIIPFTSALNPANTEPFTMEAWFLPLSDQINAGQSVINNRYAYSGAQRQGWVIFQRAPNNTYAGKPGYEGVGWNFRMYAGGTGIDVLAEKPYEVGQWIHFVAVYAPVGVNGATTTVYINGVEAGSASGNYTANTDDHGAESVNGPAGLAFGAYNNTSIDGGGQTTQANAYFGAIDEFAFYDKILTPARILEHYQNGTNTSRATPYPTMISADAPVVSLLMDETGSSSDSLINIGELRADGNPGINEKAQRNAAGAIAEWSDFSVAAHWRNGGGTRINVPFRAKNNPHESVPFSVEGWFRAGSDRINPGAAVINNRKASFPRTGWVIFQRAPNESYGIQSGYEGVGYNFRTYNGVNSDSGASITTGKDYEVGEWQHVVFTWSPEADTGEGNWSGTFTAYVNGEQVAQNTGLYSANTDPGDGTAADLAIGSYNAASNWGQEFEGDIDEVAIYDNHILTADQVLAHYQAGTNAHPAIAYQTLVLTAPYQYAVDTGGAANQRIGPATYLRMNDPAPFPAVNVGSAGPSSDASFQGTAKNDAAGPQAPTYKGFGSVNQAGNFDGAVGWVGFNSPPPLDFGGNITLEAWIKPAATQGTKAKIISHGPALLSFFAPDAGPQNGSIFTSPEVFLQIEEGSYGVGSSDGTNEFKATAEIPAGDLGGSDWIYLAGKYDGANWTLYRNGVQIGISAAATGALPVPNGDWAIGSTGAGWEQLFAGGIDEAAIYNKALTAEQIQAHYNNAVGAAEELKIESVTQTAANVTISWQGGSGKFLVQKKADLNSATWSNELTTTERTATLPKDGQMGFFRIMDNYTGPNIP